jgi:hypothetical protein
MSTRVTAAWTFSSQHAGDDAPEPLPLMAVRFQPDLDRYNRAPAGGRYRVPFSIDLQGAAGVALGLPAVEASFDDGATWTPAAVRPRRDGTYTATVRHPAGNGFVSLRAAVADGAGNRVEQTILRAYQLAAR